MYVLNKKGKEGIIFVCFKNDYIYWCGSNYTDFVQILGNSEKTETTKFGSSNNTEIWIIKSLLYLLFSYKTSNGVQTFSMISDIEFTPDRHFYKPVIFYNDFWNMKRDYFPINDTIK